MNTLQNITENSSSFRITVFVDICQDYLDYAIDAGDSQVEVTARRIAYRLNDMHNWIAGLVEAYNLNDASQIQFVCEPTGGLQHRLLLVTRHYRAELDYVDTERMYNARMITYGNAEKTDEKDPWAIRSLYMFGEHHRAIPTDQLHLSVRSISHHYEELSQQAISARNKIHGLLKYVFVDYKKATKFTFGRSGQALAREFSFCPQFIVNAGYEQFCRRLKAHVPQMRTRTLDQLWQMAQRSVAVTSRELVDPRRDQLAWLYRQWMMLEEYKCQLKQQLREFAGLYRQKGLLPAQLPDRVSEWMLVRVIAETGPLHRFSHVRQLWKYIGLKLARRQSGKYKGQVKITKKGSSLVRKLLFQICLPLVQPAGWLHAAYQRQIPSNKSGGEGIRAMTGCMRKFVKVMLAIQHSGQAFDLYRLNQCQSRYALNKP